MRYCRHHPTLAIQLTKLIWRLSCHSRRKKNKGISILKQSDKIEEVTEVSTSTKDRRLVEVALVSVKKM